MTKFTFEPLKKDGTVTFYSCGPTVYNYPHIGNYRAYIFADILKRTLSYNDFTVDHIMNLTDIDDKTIRDSIKEGKNLIEFTEFYSQEFFKDRDALNIIPPRKYTKATDYVPQMVTMIEKLIEKGYAYKSDDGSVYFFVKKDTEYGKLNHLDLSTLESNASGRMIADEYDKDSVQDFALWKAWDANDGEVFWDPSTILGTNTSLGKGRPGWHIECSAMSIAELGETIDIHTGGIDNMFPHHENEIAQSECATGHEFVKYWMHNAWLLVDGKKMAKSAGNFYTLRDIIEKGYSPLDYRFETLVNHYRTPLNFTEQALEVAKITLSKLYNEFRDLGWDDGGTISVQYKEQFLNFLNKDLNTSGALAVLWATLDDKNISNIDKRATLLDFDRVLGLGLADLKEEIIPSEVLALVSDREQARLSKDFTKSDELRDKIKEMGYEVLDTDGGAKVRKI